jgi:hypothetical protein
VWRRSRFPSSFSRTPSAAASARSLSFHLHIPVRCHQITERRLLLGNRGRKCSKCHANSLLATANGRESTRIPARTVGPQGCGRDVSWRQSWFLLREWHLSGPLASIRVHSRFLSGPYLIQRLDNATKRGYGNMKGPSIPLPTYPYDREACVR